MNIAIKRQTRTAYVPVTIISGSMWEVLFNLPNASKAALGRWLQGDYTVDAEAIFRSMPDVAQHDAEVEYGTEVERVLIGQYDERMRRTFHTDIKDTLSDGQARKIEGALE